MNTPVLTCRDVSLGYSAIPALSGITGELHPGRALALIGPNGSGKTTFMRGLLGQVTLLSGTLDVHNTSMGHVPQSTDIDLTFPITTEQVVTMGLSRELRPFSFPSREQKERVRAELEHVGLADRAKHRFGYLSGGQRQRVLVARALVSRPGLILLDEPFNGLDEPNRSALIRIISEAKAQGTAFVISTHDLRLAREVCDDVLLLAGRQVAFDSLDNVLTPSLISEAYGGLGHDDLLALGALSPTTLAGEECPSPALPGATCSPSAVDGGQ